MKKTFLYACTIAMIALSFVACQNDPFADWNEGANTVRFAPVIGELNRSTTSKANVSRYTLQTTYASCADDAGIHIPLALMTAEGFPTEGQISSVSATRGTLINTTGEVQQLTAYDDIVTSFMVSAWREGQATPFIPAYKKVMYRDGPEPYWITVDPNDETKDMKYEWKKDETMTFYAYANLPSSGASIANADIEGQTLTYTVPVTSSAQADILMAAYTATATDKSSALVPLMFYHPLTAVTFKIGTISEGVTVSDISIEGVYPAGKGTITPTTAAQDSPKDKFIWTRTDGSAFTKDDETLTVHTTSDDRTLLLIPHVFAADSEARLHFAVNTPTGTLDLYTPLAGTTWKAGYTNEYTIGYELATGISVIVHESFNGTAKSDVGAMNNGNEAEFVRAAISANWVDADGDIYGSCDFTTEGTLVNYLASDCNWTLHTDGFYYYSKAIKPNAVTAGKIFGSYIAPESPEEGLSLEMAIIVQGKEYDADCTKVKAAWGNDIPVTNVVE